MNAENKDLSAQLVNYPAPDGTEASRDFNLYVNHEPVFVYTARVSAIPVNQVWPGHQRPLEQTEIASFAYFDFSGKVSLEIHSTQDIHDVVIRPISYQCTTCDFRKKDPVRPLPPLPGSR